MAILFSMDKIGKVTVNQKVGVIQDSIKPASCREQSLEKINTTGVLCMFSAARGEVYWYLTWKC